MGIFLGENFDHLNKCTDVFEMFQNFDLEEEVSAWILFQARFGWSEGHIRKFLTVANFVLNWVGKKPFEEKHSLPSKMIKSAVRMYANEPKATIGFSWKILREILLFLHKTDSRMFWVILLTFQAALRTGELLKLRIEDFEFENGAYQDCPMVTVRLRDTKTGKKRPKQTQTSVFQKTRHKDSDLRLPSGYTICLEVVRKAKLQNRKDRSILPFRAHQKSQNSLRNSLYSWFKKFKFNFAEKMKKEYGWELNVSEWRFYAFRTSFCGLSITWGVPLDRVKRRMRHSPNSKITENTYLLNCLFTKGFDEDFDREVMECPFNQKLFSEIEKPSELMKYEISHEEQFNNPSLSLFLKNSDSETFSEIQEKQEVEQVYKKLISTERIFEDDHKEVVNINWDQISHGLPTYSDRVEKKKILKKKRKFAQVEVNNVPELDTPEPIVASFPPKKKQKIVLDDSEYVPDDLSDCETGVDTTLNTREMRIQSYSRKKHKDHRENLYHVRRQKTVAGNTRNYLKLLEEKNRETR